MIKGDSKKTLLLSIAGIFEYYDFIIYALMAKYLGQNFFPNDNILVSQLEAFGVMAFAYIARPFGGIVLGYLGDRFNRKNVFIANTFILAVATFFIGLLPTYHSMGTLATLLIIILRIVQAFCFSIEVPGSMVLIGEGAYPERNFSFIISSMSIGSLLALFIAYYSQSLMSFEEIVDYGWRIPFLLGGVLCLISLYIRTKLFNSEQKQNVKISAWLSEIIPEYKKLLSSILIICISAYIIILNLIFPIILEKLYNFKHDEVYLALILAMLWSIVYGPIFAYLTCKFNRISLLQVPISFCVVISFLVHYLLLKEHIILSLIILQTISTSILITILPYMNSIFYNKGRFTTLAIGYNFSFALMTFLVNFIAGITIAKSSPLYIWVILSVLSILAISNMKPLYSSDK